MATVVRQRAATLTAVIPARARRMSRSVGRFRRRRHARSEGSPYCGGCACVALSGSIAGRSTHARTDSSEGPREPAPGWDLGEERPMADVGSLSIDATSVVQGAPIVFTYWGPADHASDTNWIGIWAADGGGAPVDGEYVASQIAYEYSPGTSGSVTISSGLLPPGTEYVAYYLYNDGYTSLATPVLFTVNVGKQLPPPRFRDDFGRR